MEIFTACPKGLEELLHQELQTLGADTVRSTVAGVYATGPLEFVYRACLWSRLANRVLLPLDKFNLNQADDLYFGCRKIPWHQHIGPDTTIAVQFSGTNNEIRHSQFGAQRVKDAVVDQLKATVGFRPEVNAKSPDILINARLSKNLVVVSLDLSGGSLHRRGYRQTPVAAPLKENLAAALLIRAGWPEMAKNGRPLIDPMCGSGTFLVEAAMMAADIAPGLKRSQFGFQHWLQHNDQLWQQLIKDAEQRKNEGLSRNQLPSDHHLSKQHPSDHHLSKQLPEIRGYDKDSRAIEAAEQNILQAGLSQWVRVSPKPIQAFKKPTHKALSEGLIICNPPYGERWGEVESLRGLYQALGERVKMECPGWRMAVFTGNQDLAGELKLRASKKFKLFNGSIPAQLLLFELRDNEPADDSGEEPSSNPTSAQGPALPAGAQMLFNRLNKNTVKLKPWIKREQVTCYRLYDKDMPEYAVAIDIYDRAIHVQEYAPPASIDAVTARQRLNEVNRVLVKMFPELRNAIFFKERKKQKGASQYLKQNSGAGNRNASNAVFVVSEASAKFEVNLVDYLDTGLFLDHRPVRHKLKTLAEGKRFLNLFCYTATATVQAALGGASSSLSIDMSQTYIDWAKRNFNLNNLNPYQHKTLREDCLAWLETATKEQYEFDLIFLDPPTFSNSSKMDDVLDIQRDHPKLIDQAMGLLTEKGCLVFSNNFRKFKMDEGLIEKYNLEDITSQTIPTDFSRNPKIHQCWLIKHG